MIVTQLNSKTAERLQTLHPRFEAALNALKQLAESNPENGRHEIDGDCIFATVYTYQSKTRDQKKFEIHKDYIDIQYIVKGAEVMDEAPLETLVPLGDYKPDVQLFKAGEDHCPATVHAGEFALFFPHEAHAPGIAVNNVPTEVKKIVVKVLA